jgi:hypothetical protein
LHSWVPATGTDCRGRFGIRARFQQSDFDVEAAIWLAFVQRRLGDPTFISALRERRANRLEQFTMRLETSAATALETLNDLMASDQDNIRIAAVRIALTEHVRYRATEGHEARFRGPIVDGTSSFRAVCRTAVVVGGGGGRGAGGQRI